MERLNFSAVPQGRIRPVDYLPLPLQSPAKLQSQPPTIPSMMNDVFSSVMPGRDTVEIADHQAHAILLHCEVNSADNTPDPGPIP
ncbi:MAG: hypothetical protein GF401_00385 [Chitinivibrionales bacterium]|nr:hypothetical protein [Chitinivibrionales bacterium]